MSWNRYFKSVLANLTGSSNKFARRKPIYTSLVPSDRPAAPPSGDSRPESRFDVLPANESEHYLPRRMIRTIFPAFGRRPGERSRSAKTFHQ